VFYPRLSKPKLHDSARQFHRLRTTPRAACSSFSGRASDSRRQGSGSCVSPLAKAQHGFSRISLPRSPFGASMGFPRRLGSEPWLQTMGQRRRCRRAPSRSARTARRRPSSSQGYSGDQRRRPGRNRRVDDKRWRAGPVVDRPVADFCRKPRLVDCRHVSRSQIRAVMFPLARISQTR
jgi:hypothetical protein